MEYVAAAIAGYLLGSVPVALLVARRHGVDLYSTSDGNPGAWNALEQLGPRRAWPAFAGDGLKGTLAGVIGITLAGPWAGYAGVAGAMLGHAFPLFARLRGGKSVMTFVGGMFALVPAAALLALALGAGVSFAARSFAWGVRAGVAAIVPAQLALVGAQRTAATGALMCMIGALFVLRGRPRTSARATSAPAAGPPE
jgi:acyl phosphate:glycerol-3-phosphate acyltransferase